MAVGIVSSGTTGSLTPGTETTICDISAAGVYQVNVNVTALVTNEYVEVKLYSKPVTATNPQRMFYHTAAWFDGDKLVVSPPYISPLHYVATLTQRGGTGRAFPFSITQA